MSHKSDWYAGPPGYNAAKDPQDGYQFIYPFGWQEVSVDGTDVVYKDIIEPLESASVTISKTDKTSVTDFGNPLEVTYILEPLCRKALWTAYCFCKMTSM